MRHLSKMTKYLNEISVSKRDLDPFLRCQIYVHQGIQLSVNSHELGIPENRRRRSSWILPHLRAVRERVWPWNENSPIDSGEVGAARRMEFIHREIGTYVKTTWLLKKYSRFVPREFRLSKENKKIDRGQTWRALRLTSRAGQLPVCPCNNV